VTDAVITSPSEVTPEWLTGVLRGAGCLPAGEVRAVRVTSESTSFTGRSARLAASYSDDAPAGAPRRLFLKMGGGGSEQRVVGAENLRREVHFHTAVAPLMPDPPVLRCYDAACSEERATSHLLFDDVSETHVSVEGGCPPTHRQCERIVEAFARLHAFWWGHARLGGVSELPTAGSVAAYIAAIRRCFLEFAEALGDGLSRDRSALYARALACLEDLHKGADDPSTLTLIHGDAHFGNVLVPLDPSADGALVIDWQLWNAGRATDDLANLIALHWRRERRSALEHRLVRHYHGHVVRSGTVRLSPHDLWQGYRVSVVTRVLFMPMWMWSGGVAEPSWRAGLENAFAAFEDLDCGELLVQ
jgi:hypothetical protein